MDNKKLLEQAGHEAIKLRGPSFLKPPPKASQRARQKSPSQPPPSTADATVAADAASPAPRQLPTSEKGTDSVVAAANQPNATSARHGTPSIPTMLTKGPKSRLLPSPSKEAQSKQYTVVLDLDETVIYARDGPLYARAHLKDLLRTMHKYCEVIVWTAGERTYAQAVMREINCENIIEHMVYRHRKWFDPKDYTKDLCKLGRNLDNVLIIENTPDCVRENPRNGIIVEDFEGITNEAVDQSTKVDPETSLGELSTAGINDAEDDDNGCEESVEPASVSPTPKSPTTASSKKPKRKARDNTLLYLMEIVEGLGNSGGMTVPDFLEQCTLLKRQVVYGGIDGTDEIPIFWLPSKRRPNGSEMKVVKINRDKQNAGAAEQIGLLPKRFVSPGGTPQGDEQQPTSTAKSRARGTSAGRAGSNPRDKDGADGTAKRKRGASAPRTAGKDGGEQQGGAKGSGKGKASSKMTMMLDGGMLEIDVVDGNTNSNTTGSAANAKTPKSAGKAATPKSPKSGAICADNATFPSQPLTPTTAHQGEQLMKKRAKKE